MRMCLNSAIRTTFIFLLLLCAHLPSYSQCTSTVSNFPYLEDFEASSGNWVTGGTNSDWAWGTPAKPVISHAPSGTKCWITGGLTTSSYANNESAWLLSPCFNFSTLQHPYLKFNIFWETEKKYDGASLQYSADGGTTWSTLGSNADYVSCPGSNWFNTQNINTVGMDGWSGNIQTAAACPGGAGNGSGNWKLAQHAMPTLAGVSSVRFRFIFGAGSQCNNYDGFAIDDIWIGEAPLIDGSFSFACVNANTVSFTPNAPICNTSFAWDFGDPGSGASNTTTQSNPTHTFSSAGSYTVTLTTTATGQQPVTTTKQVSVITVAPQVVSAIKCNGDKTGSLSVQVSPQGSYVYDWNTTPSQTTQTALNIGAGLYSVKVSGAGVCSATNTISIVDPAKLNHTVTLTDARCSLLGSAVVQETGGTGSYNYSWSNGSSATATDTGLHAGNYYAVVRDSNNCIDSVLFTIKNEYGFAISLGRDTVICPGERLKLNPGNYQSYLWQDSSRSRIYTVFETGIYSVEVVDSSGCSATGSIKVTADCSDVYFPDGFTPNNDGVNDGFGAIGNVAALSNYSLQVYDRWGLVVFETTNPFEKWNGLLHGKPSGTQTFVWMASYTLPRKAEKLFRKGAVTVIR